MSQLVRKRGRRPSYFRAKAFTLVEVLIVVMIMAILAATIVPQFSNSSNDAKVSSITYNLHILRTLIQQYRSQHFDVPPSATLIELISSTNSSAVIGTGSSFPYGPYLAAMPINPYTNSSTVRPAGGNPPAAASGAADAGWLYDAASGGVWVDNASLLSK